MKKLTFPIIILVVFAAGFVASKYWYSDKSLTEIMADLVRRPEIKKASQNKLEVFTAETTPAVIITESKMDVEKALSTAFMRKYSKMLDEVTVTVGKLDEAHAAGSVRFGPETVGGGWFLAAKEDGVWKVVADGNGIVRCELVEPYSFSIDMVPECWDEVSMTMRTPRP